MDIAQRRARLGRRHHLAETHRADTPLQVARDLVRMLGMRRTITPRFRTPLERELSA